MTLTNTNIYSQPLYIVKEMNCFNTPSAHRCNGALHINRNQPLVPEFASRVFHLLSLGNKPSEEAEDDIADVTGRQNRRHGQQS